MTRSSPRRRRSSATSSHPHPSDQRSPQNVEIFAHLFGAGVFVGARAFTKASKQRVEPIVASSPWALLVVGLVFIGLLAANERLNARLVPESAA